MMIKLRVLNDDRVLALVRKGPVGFGAPCGIRTHGPRIRNPVLYPSELRGRTKENQWFFRCEVVSQVDLTAKLTATGAPPVLLPSQRSINFLRRFPHHVRHHVAVRVHREAYITV